MRSRPVVAILALLATLGAARAFAAESSWRIVRAELRVVCPLTVGGSFEAKTRALRGALEFQGGKPAALGGELSVDLKTLDTGIALRNDHLQNQYLEIGKADGFDRAVLSEIRLARADADSFQGRTAFSGTLRLHGMAKPVSGQAEIRREAGGVRVEAGFAVALADFGIAKPQYLGVGVKSEVEVKVSLFATSEVR